ncbi:uncharacterized protein LOC135216144 [Macrobrachium nipponense]|uniref:uncharacterized protein LOC135216144 n=1 Tax=Macrobrachium nipponense TaxID=159736 RepID=UPI0030C8D153
MAPRNRRTVARCAAVMCLLGVLRECKSNKKRLWVREWLRRREDKGIFDNLCWEMRLGDDAAFYNYHRMNKEDFDYLLRLVGPKIAKQDTRMRKAIPPEQRLSVTLRHLATGESKTSLGYSYRISPNLLSSVVPEVCEALYACSSATVIYENAYK